MSANLFGPGWTVILHCCDGWPVCATDTWAAAMDAALAHVAEHHTKPLLAASEAAERAQKPAEDAFWERYRRTLADDDEDDPFPPDPDHLSRVADDLTTLTANRRALDDAHRLGGCRD